jgi:hypothetical protein
MSVKPEEAHWPRRHVAKLPAVGQPRPADIDRPIGVEAIADWYDVGATIRADCHQIPALAGGKVLAFLRGEH